jgi:hypothetical protein
VVWWIAVGIAGAGMIVLLVALGLLVRRLSRLRRLERTLRARLEQARQLEEPVLALQQRAEEMQQVVVSIQEKVDARMARKAAEETS